MRSFKASFSLGSGEARMYLIIVPAISSLSDPSSAAVAPPTEFLGGASSGGKRSSVDSLALFLLVGVVGGSGRIKAWSADD